VLSSLVLAAAASLPPQARAEEASENSPLVARLFAKSELLREERRKERLQAHYSKIYTDYFDFVDGSRRDDTKLSANGKAIRSWLDANK
jgi:hypothetical protein